MYCSHALEHCLDFEGFIKGVEHLEIKVIRVECPQRGIVTSWDCTLYDFMKESKEIDPKDILKYFTSFDLVNSAIVKKRHHDSIIFTLKRKKP